jgi:DNA-binding transcriptional LysR family regulator
MIKLEGLGAFTALADAGSISEAARRLGVPKSVVSERLAELERELGGRLAQRTTRKMSLTEDGHAFLPRARRILQEAQDGRNELAERRGELTGPLRLSAPVSFGCLHLAPALISFMKLRLGIAVSLELDDRFADIVSGGFDAATPRWRGAVMWFDVKEGEASIFLTPKRSYVVVADPDGQAVPGGECGEIVEPLPWQTPEQSIWS